MVIGVGPDQPFPWLIAYTAVHRAGAVAVPVNTRLAGAELRRILDHAEPTVVLASATTEAGEPWAEVAGASGLRVLATTGDDTGLVGTAPRRRLAPPAARRRRDRRHHVHLGHHRVPQGGGGAAPTPPEPSHRRPEWNGLGFMTASPFSTTSGALLVHGPMRGD